MCGFLTLPMSALALETSQQAALWPRVRPGFAWGEGGGPRTTAHFVILQDMIFFFFFFSLRLGWQAPVVGNCSACRGQCMHKAEMHAYAQILDTEGQSSAHTQLSCQRLVGVSPLSLVRRFVALWTVLPVLPWDLMLHTSHLTQHLTRLRNSSPTNVSL